MSSVEKTELTSITLCLENHNVAEWWTQLCFGEPNVLSNTGLSRDFWAQAVTLACHLIYRSLTSAIEFQIPKEVWTGQSTNYSSLQVFGCPIYAHVRDGKLEPRAKKCIPWLCMRWTVTGCGIQILNRRIHHQREMSPFMNQRCYIIARIPGQFKLIKGSRDRWNLRWRLIG